jgi:hypothetical protein
VFDCATERALGKGRDGLESTPVQSCRDEPVDSGAMNPANPIIESEIVTAQEGVLGDDAVTN